MNNLRQNPQQNLKNSSFCRNTIQHVFSTQIPGVRIEFE